MLLDELWAFRVLTTSAEGVRSDRGSNTTVPRPREADPTTVALSVRFLPAGTTCSRVRELDLTTSAVGVLSERVLPADTTCSLTREGKPTTRAVGVLSERTFPEEDAPRDDRGLLRGLLDATTTAGLAVRELEVERERAGF